MKAPAPVHKPSRRQRLLLALLTFGGAAAHAQVVSPVVLSAGQEANWSYNADAVAVQMVSRPYFGTTAADWPSVEVGPASLTFLRDATGGAMVLLGDTALQLPGLVALDPDGRSAAPVEFAFSYDRKQTKATLAIGGQSFELSAQASAGPLKVVVAAGAVAAWNIPSLQIGADGPQLPAAATAVGDKKAEESAAGDEKDGASSVPAGLPDRAAAVSRAAEMFAAGSKVGAEQALESASRRHKGTAAWHLDIAGGFVRIALAIAAQGRKSEAMAAAQEALSRLELAVDAAKGNEDDIAAAALEQRGWIEERFLGDWAAAKASYRSAAQRWPQGGSAARAEQKLVESETEMARKSRGPGG